MLPDPWVDLYRSRWEWVDREVDEFLTRVRPELHEHFSTGAREFNAVLFGPTQSGKTTLILRMLGLRDDALTSASELLRAGRPSGQSSTAVPTRYEWSTEPDLWQMTRLGRGGGALGATESLTEEQLVDRLASYRDADGRPVGEHAVLSVGLPKRLRAETSRLAPRIFDLPGALTHDAEEARYAAGVIRDFAPRAHVVVIVVRADTIRTTLATGLAEHMPELSTWTDFPERFRLVVTHAVSADSVRQKLLESEEHISADWIRGHVLDELCQSSGQVRSALRDAGQRARVAAVLYPIEFGDSWRDLGTSQPALRDAAAPLIEGLIDELVTHLSDQASSDARRIGIPKALATVRTANRRREAEMVKQVNQAESLCIERSECVADATAKLSVAKSRLAKANKLARERDSLENTAPPLIPSLDRDSAELTGNAIDSGGELGMRLERAAESAWDNWWGQSEVRELRRSIRISTPLFPIVVNQVYRGNWNCCGHSRPVFRTHKHRKQCRDKQWNAWVATRAVINTHMQRSTKEWLKEVTEKLKSRQLTTSADVADKERTFHTDEDKLGQAQAAVETAKQELASFRQDTAQSEQLAADMNRNLSASLNKHIQDLATRAHRTHGDERDSLALAIGLALLNMERLEIRPDSPIASESIHVGGTEDG